MLIGGDFVRVVTMLWFSKINQTRSKMTERAGKKNIKIKLIFFFMLSVSTFSFKILDTKNHINKRI